MRAGTIAAAACVALAAYAQDRAAPIVIELQNPRPPFAAIELAEATASRIYAGIGIRLQFRMGTPRWQSKNISIEFDTGMPDWFHTGALAYSVPYATSGPAVHVLLDRVRQAGSDPPMGVLLGHVIAHELGHVLKCTSSHSDDGIMKAHWTHADLERMTTGLLRFDSQDVEAIRAGITRRTSLARAQ
jgi:hypothetical protein